MEHLLYGELLKRAQHLMWTEAIFPPIINIFLWLSLGRFLFPTPAHRNQRLHSLANIMFVIALADSDLVIPVCCMPLSAQAAQTMWEFVRLKQKRPKFHFFDKNRNKNDSPLGFVLLFTASFRLESFGRYFF